MEGKTVILSVLVISLVMAQIQVEAIQTCCPTTNARNAYNICRQGRVPRKTCASRNGCIVIYGACPSGYTNDNLEKPEGDAVNEYCKVGCVSSVCSALTTLQKSDASEVVIEAVDQCAKACLSVCAKGSMTVTESA